MMSRMAGNGNFAGRNGLREISRIEWRIADGGDPAALLEDFLADAGLPARDLTSLSRTVEPAAPRAAIHLSADASSLLTSGALGAPTPAPAVPDLVAIMYEPTPTDPAIGPGRPDPQVADWGPSRRPETLTLGAWEPSWSEDDHARAIRSVRASIAEGDVYQVNVVGHASVPYTGDPHAALTRVAGLPGARYPMVLEGRGWALACASPETLVSVVPGRVATLPIKGTRPATEAGRHELLASEKERAEHIMIVDLSRNDLARIATTGSVRVEELYAIRRWSNLWQAESVVSATPAPGLGLAELLRAVCPGGSVTGAPKLAALRRIASVEPVGRGPSMGALGWFTPDRLDLGLTIRTVAAAGGRLHLWAGGGITWSSDPAEEVAEAAAKAAPIRAALAQT